MADANLNVPRTTSTLNCARNDTGRTAFCGPVVISAVTGFPVSKVEAKIHDFRRHNSDFEGSDFKGVVKGTYSEDVESAFAAFGYRMSEVANYLSEDRKARPTVWSWMQRPRNAWAHYLLAIHKGREGHWILIKGVKMCDTFTNGRWVFACDGPHRGCRIMEIFEVKRAIDLS